MNDLVNSYISDVLVPQLNKLNVSLDFQCEICNAVSEQMISALFHWKEMREVFLVITEEEARFYEPAVSVDVRTFVVLTLRNSPIETLQSDNFASAGLSKKISDDELKKITSDAILFFENIDFDAFGNSGNVEIEYDLYNSVRENFFVAWRALETIGKAKEQSISFSSYDRSDKTTILDAFLTEEDIVAENGKFVVDGYDITVDSGLYGMLKDIAESKQVFFTDCFKMVSRNVEKLFAVIEYVLANDAIFLTTNYMLGHTFAEKRNVVLKAAGSSNTEAEIKEHINNPVGLTELHKKYLEMIR